MADFVKCSWTPVHQVCIGETVKLIGLYSTEMEAVHAHDKSLIKMGLVKPGVVLNLPVETYDPSNLDDDPNIARLAGGAIRATELAAERVAEGVTPRAAPYAIPRAAELDAERAAQLAAAHAAATCVAQRAAAARAALRGLVQAEVRSALPGVVQAEVRAALRGAVRDNHGNGNAGDMYGSDDDEVTAMNDVALTELFNENDDDSLSEIKPMRKRAPNLLPKLHLEACR